MGNLDPPSRPLFCFKNAVFSKNRGGPQKPPKNGHFWTFFSTPPPPPPHKTPKTSIFGLFWPFFGFPPTPPKKPQKTSIFDAFLPFFGFFQKNPKKTPKNVIFDLFSTCFLTLLEFKKPKKTLFLTFFEFF